MNLRTRTALCAFLALAVAAGPAAPAFADAPGRTPAHAPGVHAPGEPDTGRLDTEALERAIADLPADDATAAVVRVSGRDGTWRGVAGVRDLETGRKAIADGRFRAGSVTKVFTAAVVLQLVAEGRVALDRPVREYLPDLVPADRSSITVAHLLNHTSGLAPADGPGDSFADQYAHRFDSTTPRETVASAMAKPRRFAPGKRQDYLNINYTLLGLLIEELTGTSYEHQVRSRILKPLRMRDTCFPGNGVRIPGRHNRGYQRTADGLLDVTEWNVSAGWAAGDVISTAADLERFAHALFGGEVVPKERLRHMLEVPEGIEGAEYTMGMARMTLPDGTVGYGKTGGRHGYSTGMGATLGRDGRVERVVVYSVNSTDAKAEDGNTRGLPIVLAALR
ncbi:serine hydrolase domain-containing protein [Streptomyces glaucosporus]|uniref:Serine hydrolase domain-containing protein n=1 Tax=Streptomyces glaucosporus TaxID=284044 RepID=A0ABP5VQE6_9ACTN